MDDHELKRVLETLAALDPDGARFARTFRATLDQLYDGQHTSRYRWDQLYKTEKTHCGTLIEINLQREFQFDDGAVMDFRIAGIEVDCKYSQRTGGWMIPPEAHSHICMVVSANDMLSRWSAGLVRADVDHLHASVNRDGKSTLNALGRRAIAWLFDDAELPENTLLHLPRADVDAILRHSSGQQRVNELFRRAQGRRIGRGVIATVAQQDDYMKRVRGNGGARSALRCEGIVVLGSYDAHRHVARQLGVPESRKGESVSVRLAPALETDAHTVELAGQRWRVARAGDASCLGPLLPEVTEKLADGLA